VYGGVFRQSNRQENLSCPGSSENRMVSSTTGKKIAQNLNVLEKLIDARR